MASKRKIHLFRQSAVEAGTPGDYYVYPTEELMKRTSDWSVIEHEDCIETRFNMTVLMEDIPVMARGDYSYILNQKFVSFDGITGDWIDGITICYYPKIKATDDDDEIKKKKNNKKRNQKKV